MEDQFEEFRKRTPEIKKVEEGFDIRPIQHVITQVVQFLMKKALHEKRKQDKFNPTVLGGVSFHIDHNEITKETRLHFDKSPKMWDQKAVIFDLNNMEADIMMEQQAESEIAQLDNPFRY